MERESRRPGENSDVLLAGERAEPIKSSLETEFPILSQHLWRAPEQAVLP